MKPRAAELAQSAPMASTLAMSKALTILPATPILIRSRRAGPDQGVVREQQPLAHRRADM